MYARFCAAVENAQTERSGLRNRTDEPHCAAHRAAQNQQAAAQARRPEGKKKETSTTYVEQPCVGAERRGKIDINEKHF